MDRLWNKSPIPIDRLDISPTSVELPQNTEIPESLSPYKRGRDSERVRDFANAHPLGDRLDDVKERLIKAMAMEECEDAEKERSNCINVLLFAFIQKSSLTRTYKAESIDLCHFNRVFLEGDYVYEDFVPLLEVIANNDPGECSYEIWKLLFDMVSDAQSKDEGRVWARPHKWSLPWRRAGWSESEMEDDSSEEERWCTCRSCRGGI